MSIKPTGPVWKGEKHCPAPLLLFRHCNSLTETCCPCHNLTPVETLILNLKFVLQALNWQRRERGWYSKANDRVFEFRAKSELLHHRLHSLTHKANETRPNKSSLRHTEFQNNVWQTWHYLNDFSESNTIPLGHGGKKRFCVHCVQEDLHSTYKQYLTTTLSWLSSAWQQINSKVKTGKGHCGSDCRQNSPTL